MGIEEACYSPANPGLDTPRFNAMGPRFRFLLFSCGLLDAGIIAVVRMLDVFLPWTPPTRTPASVVVVMTRAMSRRWGREGADHREEDQGVTGEFEIENDESPNVRVLMVKKRQ